MYNNDRDTEEGGDEESGDKDVVVLKANVY